MQIEDTISDRNSNSGVIAVIVIHAEREVLYWKRSAVSVRGCYPRLRLWIVCFVQRANHSHPRTERSSNGSSKEHEPNEIANCSRASWSLDIETDLSFQRAPASVNRKHEACLSAKTSQRALQVVPSIANALAIRRLTKPCISPDGASGAYVRGLTDLIG